MPNYFANNGLALPIEPSNIPNARYDSNVGKTFVTWAGPSLNPYVAEYDHSEDTWSSPTQVGTNPLSGDTHGPPAIVIDDNGILHAFYGVHGQHGQLKHSTSDNVRDATSWTEQGQILTDATYPKPVNINGDLYVFLRFYNSGVKNQTGYVKSTDNGSTWGSKQTLVTVNTDSWSYQQGIETDGVDVHMSLHRDIQGDGTQNVYYLRYETDTDTLFTADGTDLGSQVDATEHENQAKIYDSGGPPAAQGKLGLDGSSNPHIVYGEDVSGTNKWRHIYWDGSAWQGPIDITSLGDTIFSGCSIKVRSTTDITAWLSTDQTSRAGDIEEWHYDGAWSKVGTIYDDANYSMGASAPQMVKNGVDTLDVVIPQVDSDDFTNADLGIFGYGSNGYVTESSSSGISADSYTAPGNDVVDFTLESYTAPGNDTVDFQFTSSGTATTVKIWDGSSWLSKPVKVWDGSAWVSPSSLLTADSNQNWNGQ